ncbi:hypothetical protein TNCV_3912812 [Trichonephila clavipes]|nr:hypothetical protein TNCV_3912812 [Trichonephila clavipes]
MISAINPSFHKGCARRVSALRDGWCRKLSERPQNWNVTCMMLKTAANDRSFPCNEDFHGPWSDITVDPTTQQTVISVQRRLKECGLGASVSVGDLEGLNSIMDPNNFNRQMLFPGLQRIGNFELCGNSGATALLCPVRVKA